MSGLQLQEVHSQQGPRCTTRGLCRLAWAGLYALPLRLRGKQPCITKSSPPALGVAAKDWTAHPIKDMEECSLQPPETDPGQKAAFLITVEQMDLSRRAAMARKHSGNKKLKLLRLLCREISPRELFKYVKCTNKNDTHKHTNICHPNKKPKSKFLRKGQVLLWNFPICISGVNLTENN